MNTCIRPDCFRSRHQSGLCNTCYAEASRAGLVGYMPTAPVVERINRLRDLGWTLEAIAREAGIGAGVPSSILTRHPERVLLSTHRGIMSVPLVRKASRLGVDATGTRRRVQALMRIGWPTREVAHRIGMAPGVLMRTLPKARVSHRLALAVAAVYRELGQIPGPSRNARIYAAARGYVSPAGWEDDAIDNPNATPNHTGYDEDRVQAYMAGERPADLTKADRAEAAARLVDGGLTPLEAARRLGTTATRVQVWLGVVAA